jgi:uncharacterized protein YbjT (DUF2867 family)
MILVVGGAGELGARVVRLLADNGHEVRCLVRHKTADAALRRFGATVVRGDLTKPPSLPAACEGIDTVVATVTAMGRRLARAGRGSIREIDLVGVSALIVAAEQARVRRFVFVSSAGLDRSRGTPFERAKIANEQRLRALSMRAVPRRFPGNPLHTVWSFRYGARASHCLRQRGDANPFGQCR